MENKLFFNSIMNNTLIKLIVEDKNFYASKTSLMKSEYFASLLTRWNLKEDIILEDDPRLFRHFLNCLKYDNYKIPEKYQENVTNLLNYYGVNFKSQLLSINNDIYVSNIISLNDNRTSFNFYGKLVDFIFIIKNTIELKIIFNKIIIFDDFIEDGHMICNTVNKNYANFNTKTIHNFNDLDGEFIITANSENKNWNVDIYYLEHN